MKLKITYIRDLAFYSEFIALKLCIVFWITMAKQVILFDFHNMDFKNFLPEVGNKMPFSTQSLPLQKLKLDYSRKENKQGLRRIYFFKMKTPRNF